MLLLPSSILAFCLFGIYGLFRLSTLGRRPKDFPPGPPTIPLIGNIHQVRNQLCYWHAMLTSCRCPEKTHTCNLQNGPNNTVRRQQQPWHLRELTFGTGEIYSLILGSKVLIVVSSDVAIKELLDRRSGTYSDRQEMYIGQELCSGGLRMLMMVYHQTLMFNLVLTDFCGSNTALDGAWYITPKSYLQAKND